MGTRSLVKIAAVVVTILLALTIGLVVAVRSLNLDRLKDMLAAQVQTATGRTLTIAEPLQLRLGLFPHVIARGVTLSNPPGSIRPEMARIGQFELEVELWPLLRREILVSRLILTSPDILIETQANGPGNLDFSRPTVQGEPKDVPADGLSGFKLELQQVEIENGVVVWHDRTANRTESITIEKLTLQPESDSAELLAVQVAGTARGRTVTIEGTVGRLQNALAGQPWPLRLQGSMEGLKMNVAGTIAEFSAFRGLDLKVTIEGGELIEAVRIAGQDASDMPQNLGPFRASARLNDEGGQLNLTDVAVEAGKPSLFLLKAGGTVRDIAGTPTPDLNLTTEGGELAVAVRLAGLDTPDMPQNLGPFKASARLTAEGNRLHLTDVVAEAGRREFLIIQAKGAVQDLTGTMLVDTRFTAEGGELVEVLRVARMAKPDMPESLGPFKVTARLAGASGQLNLTDVDAEGGRREFLFVQAKGAVKDLTGTMLVDTRLTAEGGELVEVLRLAGMAKPDMPQSLGPFKFSARLVSTRGQLNLSDMEAEAGRRDILLVKATGTVKDLTGKALVNTALAMDSDGLAPWSRLAGTELPAKGPVRLTGQLSGSGDAWKLSGFKAAVAGSDLAGNLAVTFAAKPQLSGQMTAANLNPDDFTATIARPDEKAAPQPEAAKEGNRVIPDQPLPVAALRAVDVDLGLQARKLILGDRQLTDTNFQIQLKDGRLLVNPFRFGLAGGTVEGDASIDAAGEVPVAGLRLNARQVELGRLDKRSPISGGKSDAEIDLKGRGASVHALMASASGTMLVKVGEGRVRNKTANWAVADLMVQLLGALNPLSKNEDSTQLTCAVARFDVKEGVATTKKGIGVRTSKVDVIGSGTVDLKTETLDIGLRPRARDGVGLSLTTPLAGLIRMRGTLDKPSIGIDAEGTMRTAATVGAGVATGGLSVLGELLFDKVTASDPCQAALGQSGETREKENDGGTQKQSKDSFLQGIFGR